MSCLYRASFGLLAAALLSMGACTHRTALGGRGDAGASAEASMEAAADLDAAPESPPDAPLDVASDPAPAPSDTASEIADLDGGASEDAAAELILSHVSVWADCFPTNVPSPDPVYAWWTVEIKGAGNRKLATLTSARLTLFDENPVASPRTQNLTVDLPTLGLSDGVGRAEQRKVSADVPFSYVCTYSCRNARWSLDLTFDVGVASASGDFECAW